MFQQCFHYDCNNRNNAGFCNTTMCINPMYSKIGTAQYGKGVQKQIVTNADRIRTMTDEELAEWLELKVWDLPWCNDGTPVDDETKICSKWDCVKCALEWLKQEVEDG